MSIAVPPYGVHRTHTMPQSCIQCKQPCTQKQNKTERISSTKGRHPLVTYVLRPPQNKTEVDVCMPVAAQQRIKDTGVQEAEQCAHTNAKMINDDNSAASNQHHHPHQTQIPLVRPTSLSMDASNTFPYHTVVMTSTTERTTRPIALALLPNVRTVHRIHCILHACIQCDSPCTEQPSPEAQQNASHRQKHKTPR